MPYDNDPKLQDKPFDPTPEEQIPVRVPWSLVVIVVGFILTVILFTICILLGVFG